MGWLPRLVPYLDNSDVIITISNTFYGGATFSLSPSLRIDREILYQGAYDRKSLLYLMRILERGDVCLDIGANIGAIALSMAHRIGRSGRVIAFEPGPMLFERLVRNIALSGQNEVIEAVQAGLSSEAGSLYWQLDVGDNPGNAFLSHDATMGTLVPVRTLDECVADLRLLRVDFIKIDVEGMESEVVAGGAKTIRDFKPILLVETIFKQNTAESQKVRELLQNLNELGYEFWEIDVPEAQLQRYNPKFNFIPCAYPKLPQNTLCVHTSHRDRVLAPYGDAQ